jgi:hypothetical protein
MKTSRSGKLAGLAFPLLLAWAPLASGQQPAGAPLASRLAGRPRMSRMEALLRSGGWREARESARGLWRDLLASSDVTTPVLADLLALRALAEAGLGMEPEAICRWQAAQYMDPSLRSVDLSVYGPAGQLLDRNRRVEGPFTGTRKARFAKESKPEYPRSALEDHPKGKILLGATLGPDGAVRQPLIVRVESGGETLLSGPGAQASLSPDATGRSDIAFAPKRLAYSALDALCDSRLRPDPRPGETGDLQRLVGFAYSFREIRHYYDGPTITNGGPSGPRPNPSAPNPNNIPSSPSNVPVRPPG